MPGVEVVCVGVPGDVQGDVDVVSSPSPLTDMVIVSLRQVRPPISLLVS